MHGQTRGIRMGTDISRRTFVQSLLSGPLFAALAARLGLSESFGRPAQSGSAMPVRPLGRTGHQVSLFSLGGQAALEDPGRHDDSLKIIHRAIDLGVNYIDTASLYGDGASERVIGEVMKERRREVFLASKTYDRSYDGSMRLLERSLKHLQTDHLDLWQLHNIKTANDVDFILSREGAVRALEKAREQGVVRFAGITGHTDPFVIRRAIEEYPFDTVLMALNAADRHDASFIKHLLPLAVTKRMGILAMKIPSRGKIFRPGGLTTMEQALRYVLTLPVSTAVIGISALHELEEDFRLAREFAPYSDAEMAALEELTRPYFAEALWYREHM